MKLFKSNKSLAEKEGIRFNKRFVTFLICVAISVFFWLLMTLSKEYTITLSFPVDYINLPQDKVIANVLPKTIDMEIHSTGFNLLKYKFKQRRETIRIDVNDAKPLRIKNHYYLYTGSRTDKITEQFSSQVKVSRVIPDTLFFNFNKKITKTVPVKANLTISFDNHYQQTDTIRLNPDHIDISGAADVVDKVSYVETVPMVLKNVAASRTFKLAVFISPDLKLVDLSQPVVQATLNVTKYTEAVIELPVEVENLPAGYSLKIFPDKISVKYNVAFNDYGNISPLQFRAVVDYTKIEPGNNKLKVRLAKFPPEIRAIKLSVEKVEYIIKK